MQLALDVEAELRRRSASVLPVAEGAALFRQKHSREPALVKPELVEEIKRLSVAASEALVHDRRRESIARVERVRELATERLDTLNRDPSVRKALYATCLAGMQALLEDDRLDDAVELGTWLITSRPDLDFSKEKVPKLLRPVLDDALAQLLTTGLPALELDSDPRCPLFVQGMAVDKTNPVLQHPAPRDYLVQVECGGKLTSRVHTVRPRSTSRLFVDVRFDLAVDTTTPALRLRYDDLDDDTIRAHSSRAAAFVGAHQGALAVYSPAPRRVSIRRSDAGPGALITIAEPYTPEKLQSVIARLIDGEPATSTEPSPVRTALETGPEEAQVERAGADDPEITALQAEGLDSSPAAAPRATPRISLWVGTGLAAAGSVSFVTGGILLAKRFRAGERYLKDPSSIANENAWDDARPGPYVAGALGAVSVSTGLVLIGGHLDPARGWLPAATGLLGAVSLALGIVDLAKATHCPDELRRERRCVNGQQRTDRGAQWLFAAAPLLTFPAAQFVRWLLPPRVDPELGLSFSRGRAELRVGAGF